jgi:hypothetical protein
LLHVGGEPAWVAGLETKSVAAAAMIAVGLREMLIILSFGLGGVLPLFGEGDSGGSALN